MQEQTNLEKLNDKVSQILQRYYALRDENEVLKSDVARVKADNELKNQEIEKLEEQNTMKDLEIEEIANKIESILS